MITTKNAQEEKAKNAQEEKTNKYNVKVLRAREIKKEDNQQVIAFDIEANAITIYGMIYRAGVSEAGNDYEMISFPARKGTDGKYYNHCWFSISEELHKNIVEQIANKFNTKE